MARNHSKCPHLDNVIQLSLSELCKLRQGLPCTECDTFGPNLWICLHKNCLHMGCSELVNDHSTEHFKINQQHCIHMNLSSQRIWCYLCEAEVFLAQRRSSLVSNDSSEASRYSEKVYEKAGGESPETSGDEGDDDRRYMDGLVGLQNIANTCYMNAALQALSNSPPLTNYFLECGDIIEATSELSGNQRKPGLAKSYRRLITDMWCRNKRSNGYVVPRGILSGIRNVHPMFRGFQQHDTQEFLRCFMDQLHEELKEVTPPPPEIFLKNRHASIDNDEDQSPCSSPSPSQSEAEYETCDSGVSEQSSLSDEGSTTIRRERHFSRATNSNLSQNQRNSTSAKVSGSSNNNTTSSSAGLMMSSTMNSGQKEQTQSKMPHRSIISDVFDGKLLSSVQCLTCDRISTREETFQDLSLPIPGKDHLAVLHQTQGITTITQPTSGVTCTDAVYQAGQDGWFWWLWNWLKSWFWGPAVSLHDCMAAFFSADELKGDNMYSCEKCNKLRNGIKYSRVLALPEMLCVHLKRFRHDLSYSSKISSPVNFPLTGLDMKPYLHKDCTSEISTYDLTAVICHHGTVGGGHYTSFAKHELSGKWFEFDDQLVTEVTPDVVQCCQAYVLFYRKSNPQMAIIRAQALELADINPTQASDIRFFVSRQWINRFNTFAEPGPIDNWALLCPHGGLPPCKAVMITRLAIPLPQPLWDYLYKRFGGGPACNHLFECDTCRRAAESLSIRQKKELELFTQLNDEFQYQESPTTIFAISMAWFRQWQLFARGVTTEEPGPINNTSIAAATETLPVRNVRPGSDYAQINTPLWKFFHGIYGGGPEIILRGHPPPEDVKIHKEPEIEQMEVEPDNMDEQTEMIVSIATMTDSTASTITLATKSATSVKSELVEDTISVTTSPVADTPDTVSLSSGFDENSRSSQITISTNLEETHKAGLTTTLFDDEVMNSVPHDKIPNKIANDSNITSSTTATHAVAKNSSQEIPEFVIPSLKRGKQSSSLPEGPSTGGTAHSDSTDAVINGRRDKRYRGGMKSSGFFGPEGKYVCQEEFQTNHIPDQVETTTPTQINAIISTGSNNTTPTTTANSSTTTTTFHNPNYPSPLPNLQMPSSNEANNHVKSPLARASSQSAMASTNRPSTTEEIVPLLIHQHHQQKQQQQQPSQQQSQHHLQNDTFNLTKSIPITCAVSLESETLTDLARVSSSKSPNINRKSKASHRKKYKMKSNSRKFNVTTRSTELNGTFSTRTGGAGSDSN